MKKFLCILLAALFVLSLTGCGMKRSEFGGKPVSLMPKYVGEGVDDPFYQFTEDDLVVRIVYDDGQIADMEDGFKVTTETDSGFFDILVSWNGLEGELMIPIGKDNYQKYKAELEAKRAEVAAEQQAAMDEAAAAAEDALAGS